MIIPATDKIANFHITVFFVSSEEYADNENIKFCHFSFIFLPNLLPLGFNSSSKSAIISSCISSFISGCLSSDTPLSTTELSVFLRSISCISLLSSPLDVSSTLIFSSVFVIFLSSDFILSNCSTSSFLALSAILLSISNSAAVSSINLSKSISILLPPSGDADEAIAGSSAGGSVLFSDFSVILLTSPSGVGCVKSERNLSISS